MHAMSHAFPAHSWSASELKEQVEAERSGEPFLVYRDARGEQRIVALPEGTRRLTIGRGPGIDIALEGDEEVSRLHAELARMGETCVVSDDGLSRNGSYVNGERVSGRRRLHDGDALRFGETPLLFRAPAEAGGVETRAASDAPTAADISATQRAILIALCRPFKDGSSYSLPATNRRIAEEVFLSVDAVKAHLRILFKLFDVEELPQNEKRVRLGERAIRSGIIAPRDL